MITKNPKKCPNPFCDKPDQTTVKEGLGVIQPGGGASLGVQIVCCWCGLEGPLCVTLAEAIEAWNNRSTPTDKRVEAQTWRTMESAPKDVFILLHEYTGDFCVAIWDLGQWVDGEGLMIQPTHWMPLPSAPVTVDALHSPPRKSHDTD